MDDKEKLKEMARPKLDIVIANLELLHQEAIRTNAQLAEISKTVHCFKMEHRSHRGWGKKVTIFTLATSITMAVIALGVEVATKGQTPAFSTVYQFLKGLWTWK